MLPKYDMNNENRVAIVRGPLTSRCSCAVRVRIDKGGRSVPVTERGLRLRKLKSVRCDAQVRPSLDDATKSEVAAVCVGGDAGGRIDSRFTKRCACACACADTRVVGGMGRRSVDAEGSLIKPPGQLVKNNTSIKTQ